MNFLSVFLLFLVAVNTEAILRIPLNCNFKVLDDGEMRCEMINSISEPTERGNSNVTVFHVSQNSTTSFLPPKICSDFPKLKSFKVESKDLKEISRNVFDKCEALEFVQIRKSQLFHISEDIFYDLISLEHLDMSNNKLVYLPKSLFLINSELSVINFDNNKLKIISSTFPNKLTSLSFKGNVCIDKKSNGSNMVELYGEINQKCGDSNLFEEIKELKSAIKMLQNNLTAQSLQLSARENDVLNTEFRICKYTPIENEAFCKKVIERASNVTDPTSNRTENCSALQAVLQANLVEAKDDLDLVEKVNQELRQALREAKKNTTRYSQKTIIIISYILIAIIAIGWVVVITWHCTKR